MSESGNILRPKRWDLPMDPDMTDESVEFIRSIEPFKSMDASKFPKVIPLDGIFKNDTRINKYKTGDVVIKEGDYGNTAFFILKGSVSVLLDKAFSDQILGKQKSKKKSAISILTQFFTNNIVPEFRDKYKADGDVSSLREADGDTRIYLQDASTILKDKQTATLNAGEFFGEIAALGRTPRTATIIADSDETELLEIKWQGLRELRKFVPTIRDHIDKLYRERSLKTHLLETPFFQKLNEDELQDVIDQTIFRSFGDFDWHGSYQKLASSDNKKRLESEPVIVEEGHFVDDLILIRAGFARLSEVSGNGHRTISYLGRGQWYGLTELCYNWKNNSEVPYDYSLRAIGHIDVLIVPGGLLEKYVFPKFKDSEITEILRHKKVLRDGAELKARNLLKLRDKDRKKKLATSQLEFFVENRFINGTATMVINLDKCTRCDDCVTACAIAHDDNPRFIRDGKVFDNLMVANACMHCQDPICMIGCPTGAIGRETNEGQVTINDLTCVGCSTCANSCPYDNIRMVEVRDKDNNFVLETSTQKPIMKATKCDLCNEQWGGPSCERACPHDALIRVDMRETEMLKSWIKR